MLAIFNTLITGEPGKYGGAWVVERAFSSNLSAPCIEKDQDVKSVGAKRLRKFKTLYPSEDVTEWEWPHGSGMAVLKDKQHVCVARAGVASTCHCVVVGDRDHRKLAEGLAKGTILPNTLDCVEGAFAAVVYDEAHQAVLVVRDWLGKQPLFWASSIDGFLLFSTDEEALHQTNGMPDVTSLGEFEPGHFLAGGGGAQVRILPFDQLPMAADGRASSEQGCMFLAGHKARPLRRPTMEGSDLTSVATWKDLVDCESPKQLNRRQTQEELKQDKIMKMHSWIEGQRA